MKQKLLVIGYVWPEPRSSAAGSRMMQLLEIFLKQDYQVIFSSPALQGEHMLNLQSCGIEQKGIELNNSSFDEFVKELNPDIVLFDRFMMEEQFSWRVEQQCPNAIRILETVDLHCLRIARQQVIKEKREFNNDDYLSDVALREIASILRCDLSLMISDIEVEILKNIYHVNEELLLHLPFMFDSIKKTETNKRWPDFKSRQHFVTIGNFRHEPNWDSVLQLKNKIWPAISTRLKNAELHIYGSYPPKKAQQLHNTKDRFLIKGWAEDALETLAQYRVCLAPIRFGAGIKGKLADAMLSGTPSVTTSIGAEAMYDKYEWPGFIKDDFDKFSNAAIDVYDNKLLWELSQENGISIVNNVYNKDKNEQVFLDKLNFVINNLISIRKNNFTGMMLNYHTMKSSKYMSQWIEEKNKSGVNK